MSDPDAEQESEEGWPPAADRVVDALGLRCPLPVVRLEAALRASPPGGTVAIRADDPIALIDLPHAAREGGHEARRLPAPEGRCAFVVTKRAL